MSNVFSNGETTIIINGGNPLPGSDCPSNYHDAHIWADKNNEGRKIKWCWDCGFKLDFDYHNEKGINVSSRFYPPKTHYGEGWDGHVTIYFMDKKLLNIPIFENSLEQLKRKVHGLMIIRILEKILNTSKER